LLAESEVTRKWRAIFKDGNVNGEKIDQAQMLIDELHPESPLRVRLGSELDEIRDRVMGKPKRRR
jgi:hypothetical protein